MHKVKGKVDKSEESKEIKFVVTDGSGEKLRSAKVGKVGGILKISEKTINGDIKSVGALNYVPSGEQKRSDSKSGILERSDEQKRMRKSGSSSDGADGSMCIGGYGGGIL